ncbi:MAG: SIR2 family protein [Chloroflexota bacterium]
MQGIYFIGAGFSKPAGLPLGSELTAMILRKAKSLDSLYENILKLDLLRYLRYLRIAKKIEITEDEIDIEDFITYLDIERVLALEDDFSQEGNRTQVLIRNLIALVLFEKQQSMTKADWFLYENFASNLGKNDIVVTFNYDTILEVAMERIGKKFRLFPVRIKRDNTVDFSQSEVIILKMHGSINWFYAANYLYLGLSLE